MKLDKNGFWHAKITDHPGDVVFLCCDTCGSIVYDQFARKHVEWHNDIIDEIYRINDL